MAKIAVHHLYDGSFRGNFAIFVHADLQRISDEHVELWFGTWSLFGCCLRGTGGVQPIREGYNLPKFSRGGSK